ncbi:hypothetical protein FQN54_001519 [Arachnomyces sp. PD_36]|nr:hypothetical protein FQN54_001519 [Arachnomyces sp. PD_36]
MSTDQVPDVRSAGPETIAAEVKNCMQTFSALLVTLNDPGCDFRDQIQPEDVKDEFGRFRIWSGNIGAHKVGRSSLDYRLRDASHIRKRVVSLLHDLNEILEEISAIIRGEKLPWDCLPSDSDSETEDNIENADAHSMITRIVQDDTELKQLHSGMIGSVTLLFRLSMAIRCPAPHDQFMKSKDIDTSYYEQYDIMHVRQKFPQAEEYLVIRLGRAISRRRQYLQYREAHHKKLAYNLEATDNPIRDSSRTEMVPESTVASSLPPALKEMDHLDLSEDHGSEAGFSDASTATSTNDTMKLRPPPLPKEAEDGSPFECPLCFMIISVRSTRSWKNHVYTDLHPFICTDKDCTTPDRFFEQRNRWFEHEKQTHMRLWRCVEGCQMTFASESSFKDHQRQEHRETFTPSQPTAFMEMHEKHFSLNQTAECPLCREKIPFYAQFRRHLGKHQEQLALFALSSRLYQTEEEDDIKDETGLDGEESGQSDSDLYPQDDGQKEYDLEQLKQLELERMEQDRAGERARPEIERAHRMQRPKLSEKQRREFAARFKKPETMKQEEPVTTELENELSLEKAGEAEKEESLKEHEERIKGKLLLEQIEKENEEVEKAERKKDKKLMKGGALEMNNEQIEKLIREAKKKAEVDRILEERAKREFGTAGTTPIQTSSMPGTMESEKSTGLKRPYHCLEPGCESSFSRAADLKRHLTSVHFPYKIERPEPACLVCKGENGFAAHRPDHLNEHKRQVHGSDEEGDAAPAER